MFIWRSLLQLPENHTSFSSLVDKGTHVAYINLQKKYPIKSRKLLRVLQRYAQHTTAMRGDGSQELQCSHPHLRKYCLVNVDCPCLVCSILKTKQIRIMCGCWFVLCSRQVVERA